MINYEPQIQSVNYAGLSFDVLRLDLVHEEVQGNKWFKLKYNISEALENGFPQMLTFGGAHSNHIAAFAAASSFAGIHGIGVIRGERCASVTLDRAEEKGMQLHFISRSQYNSKDDPEFLRELQERFGRFFLVPEGGNNLNGLRGCSEILMPQWNYDYVVVACGTGATFAGLIKSRSKSIVVGINVLRGNNSTRVDVEKILAAVGTDIELAGNSELENGRISQHCLTDVYAFSGYAGFDRNLVDFKNDFEAACGIELDHVYTVKSFYGACDLLRKKLIGGRVLVVHTGGLQGNAGFEGRYKSSF